MNTTFTYTPEDRNPTNLSINLCSQLMETPNEELNSSNFNIKSDTNYSEEFVLLPSIEQKYTTNHNTIINCNCIKPIRSSSYAIKNSPYNKCRSKMSTMSKNKLKQCSTSPRTTRTRASKLDNYNNYLKCLENQNFFIDYHDNAEDPFLKMSQYYEAEWLNRQESDMIRWINALLTPSNKLVDEDQSDDLEQAAMAWIEASKTYHKNKPMQFATQKDLFAAQIYRQSPQQWSALRKATTNLITSSNITTVLSKLTLCIEKNLIVVRDDRQIHLDLSLKKKIIDLLKCYNPLWLRIGLEAIYGQIINVKSGSNDLDGIGWFVRKNLFNNDFVKQKFTNTFVLQVNLPSYNTAMKKFILRKIFMLIYFLDRAKEQQLIRHNPCLFKTDSPYKSSYDLLMGFCADMVSAHGDIIRRLRNISYNLTHKQTHLDELNYAVKSLNDLRDGTRITRVVEILFKGNPLSQKLRLPAISKLQKIYNVNLAFTRISEHISIEGNISTRDIVNGHREKILSLFWQIIYKYLTPRYNDAATKIQYWWRTNSLKLIILKKIRAKHIAKRHLAATKIQACIRGHLIRKRWPYLQAELIKNHEILHQASTKIKHYLKSKLKLLTDERKYFVILKKTVIFVQRKFKAKMLMVKHRRAYLKTKWSVVIIQKFVRGLILRKKFPGIKKNMIVEKTKRITAVNVIKRILNKNLPLTKERLEFLKLKQAVIYIQRLYMANISMKLQMKSYIILKKTTIYIQQKFRANINMQKERKNYLKAQKSAILIQKTFRGYIVRKYWPNTLNKLILQRVKRINAINIIKRILRQHLPETQDRINFIKLKCAVLYVQQTWRANNLMKIQKKWYKTSQYATVFVQRKFRANIIMQRERQNYLTAKQSALLIQKVYRGFVTRKQWDYIKINLIAYKMKRIIAVNIIKRFLRKNLSPTQDQQYYKKLKCSTITTQRRYRANIAMRTQRNEFLSLKKSAVILQQRFLAKRTMEIERKQYKRYRVCVIRLQTMIRGYLVRKRWPELRDRLQYTRTHLIWASKTIKKVLRNRLPPTKDRIQFLKLRQSVITVQQYFRANLKARSERHKYLCLKSIIIRLQSGAKGYLFRQRIWPDMRTKLLIKRFQLIWASNIIKRCLRSNLPINDDRVSFLKLRAAVIVVQSYFKANQAMIDQRQKYIKIRLMVIQLQSKARGFLFRQQRWPALKIELIEQRWLLIRSINTIKRVLMKHVTNCDRLQFLELRKAVIVVQRAFRTRLQAHQSRKLRAAVVVIQNKFRAKIATARQQDEYIHIRAATIVLQAYTRGFLTRRRWLETKCVLQTRLDQMIAASNILKKFLRRCLPACPERLKYLALRQAVIVIQTRYRATMVAKHVHAQYLQLKHYAVILQRLYKARQATRAAIVLQAYVRGFLAHRRWPRLKDHLESDQKFITHALFEKNHAASKIQATVRGFLTRKRFPELIDRLQMKKKMSAAILIQSFWRGYCVRKKYQCRRETLRLPTKNTLTLRERHNVVLNILSEHKINQFSYKVMAKEFWNLDTCTALSKELCFKTCEGTIVDFIFRFLQYSNQSQPSIEARQPAIRVLTNLLKYQETSWLIWMRTVDTGMVSELIKIMKTNCGKFGDKNKLYCLIATWIWIALQDLKKRQYIRSIPMALAHFKFMMDMLNRKYETHKINKETMVLPSMRPTWFIGTKCQKCFISDHYATTQICKILKIIK